MIDPVGDSGAIPVLERLMQFAAQRHRILTNNIANLSTPGFRPGDVSVKDFQKQLGKAIDVRRDAGRGTTGPLQLRNSSEVSFQTTSLTLHPKPVGENLVFHDGNDRNVERIMQDLVENFTAFRVAAQLLRSRFDLLETAIRERL